MVFPGDDGNDDWGDGIDAVFGDYKCNKCPRLVEFRKKIATEKRKQFIEEKYWGKPISGYGDPQAQLLMIGLAPAAHGGNEKRFPFLGKLYKNEIYWGKAVPGFGDVNAELLIVGLAPAAHG